LQANAPPMGWPFVRRRMAAELGAEWEKHFERFEREAARAASLGQVHRAIARVDGKETLLACKLQYPDMASAVAADLKQLRLIFAVWDRWQRAVETAEIQAEIGARLTEELDYELEARHTALWADVLKGEKDVAVPTVVPSLSTRRLLTTTWLEGEPIVDFVARDQADRDRIAHSMFRAWYMPFYGYGVIHGDPHLGNYSVGDDGRRLNLYDFGCVRIFPPSFVGGVIDLYNALRNDDRALAVHAYETWGFENLSKELVDVLNVWARFLYSPLMEDKVQRIQESDSGLYGAQVARQVHVALRGQGGVRPPREFVLMDRAAVGLGSVFLRLRAEVNWHKLFHELIADFDVKVLARRQKTALDRHGLVPQS
ncbi:MAG: AarF/ABC1/UbiB kinase family protein, partial [Alphaproteobacteria bacterium]|nr:AarF/ABC1/UbiB kinase family protein [Alphaproteobacteria bacterium]